MPDPALIVIGCVVVLALIFDFINGFHDTANAIATSVLTKALSVRTAIIMAAIANFVGAILWTGVAKAMGTGIIDTSKYHDYQLLVLSALIGAIAWNLVTWHRGLPSSSSHALIGALAGAAVAASHGVHALNWSYAGLGHIITWLILSPILGFLIGVFSMVIIAWLFCNKPPSRLNKWFLKVQAVSAAVMAFSHGANDAQKSMGVITLALMSLSTAPSPVFSVPLWVKLSCAAAMALGTAGGGWRIIKTVGRKVIGLQPVHGFAAETSAATVIMLATHVHAPVSTTHVISSAVMGVGAAKNLKGVRWGIIRQIVAAWLMTLPVCALLGALSYLLVRQLVGP
ncbi:MAG: inorganic phosphate transporter [Armatimonadetes bacterium]|nr:inorganic phosphate transporter [Armatimonadota bacterium]